MTDVGRPHVVLVPGAWVGPAEFAPLLPPLRARGWDVTVPRLPSTGSRLGLAADVAAIREAIDGVAGPVALVAHSYGGAPATQAAMHPRVAHLVYLSGFALDVGESIVDTLSGEFPPVWYAADGYVTMGATLEERVSIIESDLPPGVPLEVSESVCALFERQSLASFLDPVRAAGWRVRPTTYLLTERDHVIEPEFQQILAERAGARIVRAPFGHAPFVFAPDEVARVLSEILEDPPVAPSADVAAS